MTSFYLKTDTAERPYVIVLETERVPLYCKCIAYDVHSLRIRSVFEGIRRP